MERRVFERYVLDKSHPLRATIVMSADSLVSKTNTTSIEMEGRPVNISRGGLCLTLDYDATWEVISSSKEVEIHLSNGDKGCSTRGKVTHLGTDRTVLGIQFYHPLIDLPELINPRLPH